MPQHGAERSESRGAGRGPEGQRETLEWRSVTYWQLDGDHLSRLLCDLGRAACCL